MKNNIYLIPLMCIFLTGCKSVKQQEAPNYSDQFTIVMEDYYRNNSDYIRKYKYFYLDYKEIESAGYYFYAILPMHEKSYFSPHVNPELSNLPSDYIKFKDKVFFVDDEKVADIKPGLLEYLDSLQLLDSTRVKLQLGLVKPEDVELKRTYTDDSLEGVNYVICKKEPFVISRNIRSRSYIAPDDKRFEGVCE